MNETGIFIKKFNTFETLKSEFFFGMFISAYSRESFHTTVTCWKEIFQILIKQF